MEPEDLYPNDSSYFLPREPIGQINERKSEKAKAMQGLAILKDVLKRLEEKIEFFEKHSSIPSKVRTNPEKFLIMSNSHMMAAAKLREEKEYIESLIER